MNDNNLDRSGKSISFKLMLVTAAVCSLAVACAKSKPIALHYSDDSGSAPRARFFPAQVAIAPADWSAGDPARIGGVYDSGGYQLESLRVDGPGGQIAQAIARAIEDMGLKPVLVGGVGPDAKPPFGIDFLIVSEIEKMSCVKHLVADPRGGGFTLSADVSITLGLSGPSGLRTKADGIGAIYEPPPGADLLTYRPPVSEPEQALSQAMTQAIRSALTRPGFLDPLPQREAYTTPAR